MRAGPAVAAVALVLFGLPPSQAGPEAASPSRCGSTVIGLAGGDGRGGSVLRLMDGAGRVAREIRSRRIDVTGCEDVTGDGRPELIVLAFSGGQRCCYTFRVLSLETPVRELLRWNAGAASDLEVVRLGEIPPGRQLLGRDDRLANFGGLPTVASPSLPVLFCYSGDRFRDCTRDPIAREPLFVEWGEVTETFKAENRAAGRRGLGLRLLAVSMLLGEEERAWRWMDELASDVVPWLRERRDALAACVGKAAPATSGQRVECQ